MKFVCYILLFISFSPNLLLASEKDLSIDDLLSKFFDDENKPVNQTLLRFGYGVVSIDPNFIVPENFAIAYNSQVDYGFFRTKEIEGYPSLLEHSAEFAFLGNISSHLKPYKTTTSDLTIDSWRFGFGLKNGMGYHLPNGMKLLLNHAGSIAWTRTDFEMLPRNFRNEAIQNIYDEKMKFGTIYSGGAEISLTDFMNLSLDYEHAIVFNDYTFGSLFGAWMTDNLLQRWVDFFDPVLIKEFDNYYPLVKWIYKNSVSLLLSEVRSKRGNFPFNSSKPMNLQSANLKIVLLL